MNYSKLKVVDLKKILTERGLPLKGLKADLIKRLEEDDLAKQNENNVEENDENNKTVIEESVKNAIPQREKSQDTVVNDIPIKETVLPIEDKNENISSNEEEKTFIVEEDNNIKKEEKVKDQIKNVPEEVNINNVNNVTEKTQDKSDIVNKENSEKKINKRENQTKKIVEENKTKSDNDKEETIKNNNTETEPKEKKETKNNIPILENKEKEKEIQKDNSNFEKNNNIIKTNSIPSMDIVKNNKNSDTKSKDEKELVSPSQIQIAGTSHKEGEISPLDSNPKKRTITTDDDNNDSSKRKKTEENNKNTVSDNKTPKDTILINNFVRPLVTRTVKELVEQYGEVKSFWMDTIKTHAYITYTTIEAAEAAFKGINGIKFPLETGKILSVEYLTEEESKEKIKKEEDKKLGINISGAGSKSLGSAPIRGRFDSLFSSSTAARIGIPISTGKLSAGSRKSDTSPFSASPTINSAKNHSLNGSPSSIVKTTGTSSTSQSIKIIGKNRENNNNNNINNKNTESISILSSPTKDEYVVLEVNKSVKSRVSSRYKHSKETSEVSFVNKDKNKDSKDKIENKDKDKDKNKNKEDTKKRKRFSMDDLFKKTKATPSIYYKPLTEEEIKLKEKKENEERIKLKEREKEREREKEKERERNRKRNRRY